MLSAKGRYGIASGPAASVGDGGGKDVVIHFLYRFHQGQGIRGVPHRPRSDRYGGDLVKAPIAAEGHGTHLALDGLIEDIRFLAPLSRQARKGG